jgi:hypothetical protein
MGLSEYNMRFDKCHCSLTPGRAYYGAQELYTRFSTKMSASHYFAIIFDEAP